MYTLEYILPDIIIKSILKSELTGNFLRHDETRLWEKNQSVNFAFKKKKNPVLGCSSLIPSPVIRRSKIESTGMLVVSAAEAAAQK